MVLVVLLLGNLFLKLGSGVGYLRICVSFRMNCLLEFCIIFSNVLGLGKCVVGTNLRPRSKKCSSGGVSVLVRSNVSGGKSFVLLLLLLVLLLFFCCCDSHCWDVVFGSSGGVLGYTGDNG